MYKHRTHVNMIYNALFQHDNQNYVCQNYRKIKQAVRLTDIATFNVRR